MQSRDIKYSVQADAGQRVGPEKTTPKILKYTDVTQENGIPIIQQSVLKDRATIEKETPKKLNQPRLYGKNHIPKRLKNTKPIQS